MTWLSSIFISIVTGTLGLLCGGFIMNLCVGWYRVSSFEGKSGYAIIGMALLGGFAGFVVGLIVARVVASGVEPSFLKGLGYAVGTVVTIAILVLALSRFAADLAPEIDGKALDLAIEIRCPQSFPFPPTLDEYEATAEIYLPGSKRRLPSAKLRIEEATQVDGRWVVPATIPLGTSSSSKSVFVRFNSEQTTVFNLPLPSHPRSSDMNWSNWVECFWNANKPEPAQEEKFNARYRVLLKEPPPPEPEEVDQEAADFALLSPDDSLAYVLTFFGPDKSMERNSAIAKIFSARQSELAELVASDDESTRESALLAVQYLDAPTPEIVAAVRSEGRAIAESIHHSNELPDDDPELPQILSDLSSRFNHWKRAWWTTYQRAGVDGRPLYDEIHTLSMVRERGSAMDEIELNTRAILEEIDK